MKKVKLGLEFTGFEEMMERIEKSEGDVKSAVEESLQAAGEIIADKLHVDMKKHRRSGKTEESILDDSKVKWEGTMASISVGFDIKNGGLPSVFLMYGTPRKPKDQKLYNDIYGTRTQKEIAKLQEEVLKKQLSKALGGE